MKKSAGVLTFAAQLALNIAAPFELPHRFERPFRVDPHTGIAAKLLDEGMNLYRGIAVAILCLPAERCSIELEAKAQEGRATAPKRQTEISSMQQSS